MVLLRSNIRVMYLKPENMWILFLMLVVWLLGMSGYSEGSNISTQQSYKFRRRPMLKDNLPPSLRLKNPNSPDNQLYPAEMSCGGHQDRSSKPDPRCETKNVEKYDCSLLAAVGAVGCKVVSMTASSVYLQCCPVMECAFFTTPCPRTDWKKEVMGDIAVMCYEKEIGLKWHYTEKNLELNTLYDLQVNQMYDDLNRQTEMMTRLRFHTCVRAEPVTNLRVEAYGLGWIYFKWIRPRENCKVDEMYNEEYRVEGHENVFSQNHIADFLNKHNYFSFVKFHPCPDYPNWNCFIISENVIPFTNLEYKVAYERFQGQNDLDRSNWSSIIAKTDDQPQVIKFCPGSNFFVTLLFLILLIVLLLLLLIVAAVLIGLLVSRKRKEQRRQDMEDEPYEEEAVGPTNTFEKSWERLKNFFNQLCPRPKKPPPPPPPPPPKPKPPKKPKKKPPPKKKKKKKTPSPSPPPPPPPPKPKKKKEVEEPPPPPPPPPKKKEPRGPRTEKPAKRGEAAKLDTKRAVSAVGGVSGRRRRR